MQSQTVEQFKAVQEVHAQFVSQQMALLNTQKQPGISLEDLADQAYANREMIILLEDMAKRARGTQDELKKIICYRWAREALATGGEPIRTKHCTVSPQTDIAVNLPKRGSEDYKALMTAFGVPEELQDTDACRPHWPGVKEWISGLQVKGQPLPPFIKPEDTYPVFEIKILKKLGITETA